jgi:hypothetical protein
VHIHAGAQGVVGIVNPTKQADEGGRLRHVTRLHTTAKG